MFKSTLALNNLPLYSNWSSALLLCCFSLSLLKSDMRCSSQMQRHSKRRLPLLLRSQGAYKWRTARHKLLLTPLPRWLLQKNFLLEYLEYYFLLSLNIDMNVIDSHIHFVVVTYLMDLSSRSLIFSSLLNSIGYKEVNVFSRNVNKLPVIIGLYWYRLQHSWRGALHLYV